MVNMMPASVTELLGCLARLVLFICKFENGSHGYQNHQKQREHLLCWFVKVEPLRIEIQLSSNSLSHSPLKRFYLCLDKYSLPVLGKTPPLAGPNQS